MTVVEYIEYWSIVLCIFRKFFLDRVLRIESIPTLMSPIGSSLVLLYASIWVMMGEESISWGRLRRLAKKNFLASLRPFLRKAIRLYAVTQSLANFLSLQPFEIDKYICLTVLIEHFSMILESTRPAYREHVHFVGLVITWWTSLDWESSSRLSMANIATCKPLGFTKIRWGSLSISSIIKSRNERRTHDRYINSDVASSTLR